MNCYQIYKKDCYKNEDWDIALCSWSAVATENWAAKTGQAMAWLAWPVTVNPQNYTAVNFHAIFSKSMQFGDPVLDTNVRAVQSNFSVVRPNSCRAICIENLGWSVVIMQVIVWSTISMHSMLMLGGLGECPPGKLWKTDTLRLNLRTF